MGRCRARAPMAPSRRCCRPTRPSSSPRSTAKQLIDQRARRPVVHIAHGVNEGLTLARHPGAGGAPIESAPRSATSSGPEPDFRWPIVRGRSVVTLARAARRPLGRRPGCVPGPRSPHAAGAPGGDRTSRIGRPRGADVGIVQGEIDVPSGIWGALELAFGEAGIPTVGLWARVPHYVSGMAFPVGQRRPARRPRRGRRPVGGLDRPAHCGRRLAPAGRRPHRQERRAHVDGASARAERGRGRGQSPRRGHAADRRRAGRRARAVPTRRTQRRRPPDEL